MNVVIDEAEEVYQKEGKERRSIGQCQECGRESLLIYYTGRILLKGDNITLIQQIKE
jgi:small nuclear ribonucleoprotein (snRNP)-like protein